METKQNAAHASNSANDGAVGYKNDQCKTVGIDHPDLKFVDGFGLRTIDVLGCKYISANEVERLFEKGLQNARRLPGNGFLGEVPSTYLGKKDFFVFPALPKKAARVDEIISKLVEAARSLDLFKLKNDLSELADQIKEAGIRH